MTGFTLKMIALLTMTVDHLAVAFSLEEPAYSFCRMVGRLAFPLYAFLLAEGICHTRSLSRYFRRLFVSGLLAQLPYSYLFGNGKLNILFLFSGCVLVIGGMFRPIHNPWDAVKLISGLVLCACSEYGLLGSLLVACCFLVRDNPLWRFWLAVVFSSVLSPAYCYITALTGPIVNTYNGRPGFQSGKYLFYAYYPAHLFLLAACKMCIK